MTVKYCEGCTYNDSPCSDYNPDGNCPCTNCIVKTMCQGSCNDFDTWESISGYNSDNLKE